MACITAPKKAAIAAFGTSTVIALSACNSGPGTTAYGVPIKSTENHNGDIIAINEYGQRSLSTMAKANLDEDVLTRDMTLTEIQHKTYELHKNAKVHKDAVLITYEVACMMANSSEIRPQYMNPDKNTIYGNAAQGSRSMMFFYLQDFAYYYMREVDANVTNDNPAFEFSETRAEKKAVEAANNANESRGDAGDFTWKCQLVRDLNVV